MKSSVIKLLLSALMLAFTAAVFAGVAFAWFASNTRVGGSAGNIGIEYDDSGGSADFVPGEGFGGIVPDSLHPGDAIEYKFSLKNSADNAKDYVFAFVDMAVRYPPSDVSEQTGRSNVVNAVEDYTYLAADGAWRKYNGLRDKSEAERLAFYEKFVTAFADALKIAVVPDDGTPAAAAIAAYNADFVYLGELPSYYDKSGATDFYGKTEDIIVRDTAAQSPLNQTLAAKFPLHADAAGEGKYRLLLVFDGETYATATVDGVKYRLNNSNAFLWQQLFATVVVREVEVSGA